MWRAAGCLRAVRFADNKAPGIDLGIDEEWAGRGSLNSIIEGYGRNLIQPAVMLAFVPMRPVRVVLEVITPSEGGITPERWRPLIGQPTIADSPLRGWHLMDSLYLFALAQYKKVGRRHMSVCASGSRSCCARRMHFLPYKPPVWLSNAAIQQQWRELNFPSWPFKKKPTQRDIDDFAALKPQLLQSAANTETDSPAIFVLDNMWQMLLTEDKRRYARGKPAACACSREFHRCVILLYHDHLRLLLIFIVHVSLVSPFFVVGAFLTLDWSGLHQIFITFFTCAPGAILSN